MDIENELLEFEKSIQQLSKNTKYNYKLDIKQFLNIYGHQDINKALLKKYKDEIIENYSIKTVNRKINSLNAYLRFKNINMHVPVAKIQNQTFIDDMLTNEEVRLMLNKSIELNDLRAKAIMLGLFYTGARVSELLQFKVKSIQKDEIMIKGKGSKYRKILIPSVLNNAFQEYVDNERVDNTQFLFSGQRGVLSRSEVFRILKKYALLTNINEDSVYPHAFRHLFTKNLDKKGVSYSAIKQLLGHALSTTDIYMQLSKRELLEEINSIHI
ncbi:tyrosine-type recombinase/integrase [Clostridioides difficile]|nr:tyrosine-type recombinase/integrase [Clostridioides difficile]MDI7828001.1 tyrosine-type recombinase/integrase [Clostridioides difficile]